MSTVREVTDTDIEDGVQENAGMETDLLSPCQGLAVVTMGLLIQKGVSGMLLLSLRYAHLIHLH
jgi:hypothetical protein